MKTELEQLLNSLIEKGWKPSGKECTHFVKQHSTDVLDWKVIYTAVTENEGVYNIHYSLRDLVSKESGLWQFVCENGMIKQEIYEVMNSWEHTTVDHTDFWYTSGDNYEYWVIESALTDESELESFILESIKIGNE